MLRLTLVLHILFGNETGTLPCLYYLEITRTSLQIALARALMDPFVRSVIPALIYKIQRCNLQDVKELSHFLFNATTPNSERNVETYNGYSPVLETNILLSEMFYLPNTSLPSLQTLQYITGKN